MNAPRYNISDLEKLSGIKAHTIRIWEKRYGIINPERTQTNIRYYTDEDLQKLLNISILNKNGLKISHISQMSTPELEQALSRLSDKHGGDDVLINNLLQAALDLHEEQVEKLLNTSILKLGFENAFIQVVFPFLEKVTLMWQLGKVNACQERFVNNLIRHKMVVAIDGLVGQNGNLSRNFLLFLPAGEFNELPLLFINYLLRKRGCQVVYLGPDIPLDHLRKLKGKEQYEGIVVAFNHHPKEKELIEYLSYLKNEFSTQSLLLYFHKQVPDCQLPCGAHLIDSRFSWPSGV